MRLSQASKNIMVEPDFVSSDEKTHRHNFTVLP
jgi:hypothetical protein